MSSHVVLARNGTSRRKPHWCPGKAKHTDGRCSSALWTATPNATPPAMRETSFGERTPVTGEAQEQHRGPGQLRLAAVTASAVGAAVQVVHRAARGLGAQLDGGLQVGHHHNAGALHLSHRPVHADRSGNRRVARRLGTVQALASENKSRCVRTRPMRRMTRLCTSGSGASSSSCSKRNELSGSVCVHLCDARRGMPCRGWNLRT
eukprot:scaffold2090_cov225-Prasinococcus_capsulatus_cf.AAC.46